MASSRRLITSTTLSTSAASVTFSSIPSTYTDLVLRYSHRDSGAGTFSGSVYVRLNGDTSSSTSYSATRIDGNGATASSSRYNGLSFWATSDGQGSTSTANTFSNVELYIPNYTSTTNKPAGVFAVNETNATTAYVMARAFLYSTSSAITSIDLTRSTGDNFVSGSTFYLYGIKNS